MAGDVPAALEARLPALLPRARRAESGGAWGRAAGKGPGTWVIPSPEPAAAACTPFSAPSRQGEAAFGCLKSASPAFSCWTPLGKIWRASFLQEAFHETGNPALRREKGGLTSPPGREQNKVTLEQILRKTPWKISSRSAARSHVYSGTLPPPRSPAGTAGARRTPVMLQDGQISPLCSPGPSCSVPEIMPKWSGTGVGGLRYN